MKKILAVVLLTCFIAVSLFAQQDNRRERIKSLRVAFITEQLELTPEESEKFWPLINQFEIEKKQLRRSYKRQKSVDLMTDAEIEQSILDNFEKEQKLLDLKKSYFVKMKSVIPTRKIAKYLQAEKEFKTTVLKQMRKNRRQR